MVVDIYVFLPFSFFKETTPTSLLCTVINFIHFMWELCVLVIAVALQDKYMVVKYCIDFGVDMEHSFIFFVLR